MFQMGTPKVKVVVIGNKDVGKTSLLMTHLSGKCPPGDIPVSLRQRMGKYIVHDCGILGHRKWDSPASQHGACITVTSYSAGVSNHQPHDCLLNHSFKCRSKKTSKLRVTGLCALTGEVTAQRSSNVHLMTSSCELLSKIHVKIR